MFKISEQRGNLSATEWVGAAVEALRARHLDVAVARRANRSHDAALTIEIERRRHEFSVEIKAPSSPATVARLAAAATSDEHVLLITDHLSSATFDACRRLGLACLDLDGNMYLQLGSTNIQIEGRPRTTSKELGVSQRISSPLATRSAIQILFVLLSDQSTVDMPMRQLAEASGTALGSVSAVYRELVAQNYLATREDGRRQLHQTARLFDRWVEGYRARLQPKLGLGDYQTGDARWWESADAALRQESAQWGGETAAWHIDRHLRPAQGVVYAQVTPTRLLTKYRMRKATPSDANAVVRHRFWNVPAWPSSLTVPSPLVYADLVTSNDPRQVEAAVRLRETDDVLRRLD